MSQSLSLSSIIPNNFLELLPNKQEYFNLIEVGTKICCSKIKGTVTFMYDNLNRDNAYALQQVARKFLFVPGSMSSFALFTGTLMNQFYPGHTQSIRIESDNNINDFKMVSYDGGSKLLLHSGSQYTIATLNSNLSLSGIQQTKFNDPLNVHSENTCFVKGSNDTVWVCSNVKTFGSDEGSLIRFNDSNGIEFEVKFRSTVLHDLRLENARQEQGKITAVFTEIDPSNSNKIQVVTFGESLESNITSIAIPNRDVQGTVSSNYNDQNFIDGLEINNGTSSLITYNSETKEVWRFNGLGDIQSHDDTFMLSNGQSYRIGTTYLNNNGTQIFIAGNDTATIIQGPSGLIQLNDVSFDGESAITMSVQTLTSNYMLQVNLNNSSTSLQQSSVPNSQSISLSDGQTLVGGIVNDSNNSVQITTLNGNNDNCFWGHSENLETHTVNITSIRVENATVVQNDDVQTTVNSVSTETDTLETEEIPCSSNSSNSSTTTTSTTTTTTPTTSTLTPTTSTTTSQPPQVTTYRPMTTTTQQQIIEPTILEKSTTVESNGGPAQDGLSIGAIILIFVAVAFVALLILTWYCVANKLKEIQNTEQQQSDIIQLSPINGQQNNQNGTTQGQTQIGITPGGGETGTDQGPEIELKDILGKQLEKTKGKTNDSHENNSDQSHPEESIIVVTDGQGDSRKSKIIDDNLVGSEEGDGLVTGQIKEEDSYKE